MIMQSRIEQEIELLKRRFPALEYRPDGYWIRIPKYLLPSGWNFAETPLAFQIPVGYPGGPPYGIYVPAGILFNGQRPASYSEPAPTQPPFGGSWGIFSWTTADGQWRAASDLLKGSNLLNWALGFQQRFKEGA
jgi:hypothetical protein